MQKKESEHSNAEAIILKLGFVNIDCSKSKPSERSFLSILQVHYKDYYKTLITTFPEKPSQAKIIAKALKDPQLPLELRGEIDSLLYLSISLAGRKSVHYVPHMGFSWGESIIKLDNKESLSFHLEHTRSLPNSADPIWNRGLKDSMMLNVIKHMQIKPETELLTTPIPVKIKKKYSDADYHAICRIFGTSTLLFNDLIGYCKEHPGMLRNVTFQEIFLRALLSGAPTDPKNERVKCQQLKNLEAWLEAELQSSLTFGESTATVSTWILRALRYCRQLAPPTNTESERSEMPFESYFKTLLASINNPSNKQLAIGELIANFSEQPTLSTDQLCLYIEALLYLKEHPMRTTTWMAY